MPHPLLTPSMWGAAPVDRAAWPARLITTLPDGGTLAVRALSQRDAAEPELSSNGHHNDGERS